MRKQKRLQKTMMVGGLACTMLFGGIPAAFAAEVGTAAVQSDSSDTYASVLQQRLRQLVSEVAMLADKEDSTVREDLDRGQTLVLSSGLSSSELLNRLATTFNSELAAKAGGALSQSELAKYEAEGRQALLTAITTSGFEAPGLRSAFEPAKIIAAHLQQLASDAAFYGDRDDADVAADLSRGLTLVQASGRSASDLLEFLSGSLNQELAQAADAAGATADELAKAQRDAVSELSSAISTSGYKPAAANKTDLQAIVSDRLAHLVDDAALIGDQEFSDVLARLEAGSTLVAASGVAYGDLVSRLADMVYQEIDNAANQGDIDGSAAQKAKSDARSQIARLVMEPGLKPQTAQSSFDGQAIIDAFLSRLTEDVAFYADLDTSAVEDAVATGVSLQRASGMSGSNLLSRLADSVGQELEVAASSAGASADTLAVWKATARQQIAEKLNN